MGGGLRGWLTCHTIIIVQAIGDLKGGEKIEKDKSFRVGGNVVGLEFGICGLCTRE